MFGELNLCLDCMGVAEVEVDGLYLEQIAAQAWVEAVGVDRLELLVSHNAPEVILRAQVDRDLIAAELQEAPAAFQMLYGYVYDNGSETWLIELDCEFDFVGAGAKFSDGKRLQRDKFGSWLRLQSLVLSLQAPCRN